MPEDTIVYVFQDNHGRWLASTDEDEARLFVTPEFLNRTIEAMTLGELYKRQPKALVRTRAQYYWAQDLMQGTVRGGPVY